jgi:hypothetical protein
MENVVKVYTKFVPRIRKTLCYALVDEGNTLVEKSISSHSYHQLKKQLDLKSTTK